MLRWRAPVAAVLLAALVVRLGLGVVEVAAAVRAGAAPGVVAGLDGSDLVGVVVIVVVVVWLAGDAPRAARRLALAALVVFVPAVLGSAALVISGWSTGRWWWEVHALAGLAGPALAVAVLVRLLRRPVAAQPAEVPNSGSTAAEQRVAEIEPVPPPYPEAAGWAPEEAAGAAWLSAGAAAAGAAASGWGSTGDAGGWEPGPWPDAPGRGAQPEPDADRGDDGPGDDRRAG